MPRVMPYKLMISQEPDQYLVKCLDYFYGVVDGSMVCGRMSALYDYIRREPSQMSLKDLLLDCKTADTLVHRLNEETI